LANFLQNKIFVPNLTLIFFSLMIFKFGNSKQATNISKMVDDAETRLVYGDGKLTRL